MHTLPAQLRGHTRRTVHPGRVGVNPPYLRDQLSFGDAACSGASPRTALPGVEPLPGDTGDHTRWTSWEPFGLFGKQPSGSGSLSQLQHLKGRRSFE